MQSCRSLDPRRISNGSISFSPRIPRGSRAGLMNSFETEDDRYALSDLPPEGNMEGGTNQPLRSNGKAVMNGSHVTARHD